MKKLVFVFLFGLAIMACSGNQTTRAVSVDSTSVDTIEVVDSTDTVCSDTICID